MQKTNILLAEDDYDFGSILKQYLLIHHFNVTWATDGEEALAFFTSDEHQEENACQEDERR